MKYKVQSLEVKRVEALGKDKMNADLVDIQGNEVSNVTIWQDFPDFKTITFGSEVDGTLKPAKDPKYGPTLYPEKNPNGTFKRSPAAITKAMEKKEQSIEKFQGNKELGIKISSTLRMAVDIALAEYNNGRAFTYGENLGEAILEWRAWLWRYWDAEDKDFLPF